MTGTVAVVDVGSMTVRLTVVSADGRRYSQPFITQLGRGLVDSGALSADSLEATADALEQVRTLSQEHGATTIRAIGTEAARAASNRDDLIRLVAEKLDTELEILSGTDEGRLAFCGAQLGLDRQLAGGREDPPVLLIDIGGGSTEFVVGSGGPRPPDAAFSAEIGAVTLTSAYLAHDPPEAAELSAALSVVELHVDDARRAVDSLAAAATEGVVVGVGGTITTTAAVEIGLEPYDPDRIHGFVLTRDAVEDVFRTLATEPLRDRIHNPGLPEKRAGVIVGGLCVLVESFRQLGMDEIVVSDRGLADGVAAEMLVS